MKKIGLKNIYFLIVFIWLLPCSSSAYEMDDCIACHCDNPGKGIPQISIKEYRSSIHGTMMACEECHTDIEEGHEKGGIKEKVNCNNCHTQKNLHGAAAGNRLECYSCHTKHNILPAYVEQSSVNKTRFRRLCIECHKMQWGGTGYLKWFTSFRIRSHKKEDFSKNYDATNCTGCHGKIEIHEKTEKITGSDCSKCHMKDGKSALMGRFHAASNSGVFITGLSVITQIMLLAVIFILVRFILKPLGRSGKRRK
jgi:hypothetical protein